MTDMLMRLIDNHIHLQDPKFNEDLDRVMSRAEEAGIARFACNGTHYQDWPKVFELSQRFPSIIPCYGLHPWYVERRPENWLETLSEFLQKPGSGLGEIGLDRWIEPRNETIQEDVFRKQLGLAKQYDRPISIHCLRAWGWLLEILQQEQPFPSGFLIHAYGGAPELVVPLARLGAYFSFAGNVLEDRKIKQREALRQVPPDRLLIESDAPDLLPPASFQAPVTESSRRNEPVHLPFILKGIAAVLERDVSELSGLLWKNSTRFWRLLSTP